MFPGRQAVYHFRDEQLGLSMFFVRDSHGDAGISIGGCRAKHYQSEMAALEDARRLARNMTYKYKAIGLGFGGLKAVVYQLDDARRPESFRRIGEWLEQFDGSCYLGTDVGTCDEDMSRAAEVSPHIIGGPVTVEGGTFAQLAATGVIEGLRSALMLPPTESNLQGRSGFVIGLGNIGIEIASQLILAGCTVSGYDPRRDRRVIAEAIGVEWKSSHLHGQYDFVIPCGYGGDISGRDATRIETRAIGGAANNPLQAGAEEILTDRGIRYSPDFIISSGAIVLDDRIVSGERATIAEGLQRLHRIPLLLSYVFLESQRTKRLPSEIAAWAIGVDS